jgi:hypothetical protein
MDIEGCHWLDWSFGGEYEDYYTDYYYEDGGSEPYVGFEYDELFYFDDFKGELVDANIAKPSDKLTIIHQTDKAYLFAINNVPLFWVPIKLIRIQNRRFYINQNFDIQKATQKDNNILTNTINKLCKN